MKLFLAIFSQKQSWLYFFFGMTLLLSATVIIGWLAGISSLVQIDESSVPMQFNTALSLFGVAIAGIALFKDYYRVTLAIAGLTLLIALLTLAQYIFEINLFIDELIVTHDITTHSSSPGRMAPNTALCFLLSSVCLLWLSTKTTGSSGITIIAGTLSLIFVLSILSILGYLFSIQTSYGWGNMTYMSLQTAIGFLCFSIGMLLHIAFHRHARKVSVYYMPLILGSVFLLVTLLFTNDLNNKNQRSQDPTLILKKQLINDHISINWNNELLRLTTNLSNILQANASNTVDSSMPDSFISLYVEYLNRETVAVFQHPKLMDISLELNSYAFHSAANNHTATALGIENTDLFLMKGKQNLLLKMPVDVSSLNAEQDITAIIVLVDIEQFIQETLSSILSERDQLIFTTSDSTSSINLPFYTNQSKLNIQYAVSEFERSQNSIVYLVLCFGLVITLALVVATFFAQRSAYQTRKLLKQKRDQESHDIQLQQSHLTLTLASEVARLGIWRWNVETDELSWNDRMFQMYETPEEVRKSGLLFDYWYQTVHADDRDRAAKSLQEAARKNQNWEEEFKLDLPGGVIKHIKATAICYKDNTTQTTLVFGGNIDVTLERELQLQLQEKTKQAEQNNIAKSQFLANMSHELRTPMNGVLGIGELLKNTELNSKQHQYLYTMMSSAEKLLSLLNDILDLSKIEAGEMHLEMICVPFEEVVAETLKSLATSAHEKKLDYHYHKEQSVPEWVYTDPIRLGQIITNIVSNAIKFTEVGEITVNISIENGRASKHDAVMVIIEVCDTGIGLSADQTKAIFAPFSQADQSITRRYGGTGLGLSIVQQLVDLFEGSIDVKSELGKGTCVRFGLPMRVGLPEEGRDHSNAEYDYYQQHAPTALGAINCLVVDDNDINRKWLDDMLHSWQCNVTLCANANDGLKAWTKSLSSGRLFDALIIDRNIKGLEAFEFIRTIQKQSANKKMVSPATVFVMTNKNLQDDLTICAELNITQHLIKPIKQSEVFNALMTALGKKHETLVDTPDAPKVEIKQKLNVLVAEDHPVNQMLIKEILEIRGHKIRIVENGRLAVEALESEQFDAILMDVQMPIMDGITATKLIRQGAHQPNICIIGVTAKALKGDENICLEAGMNYYMTKPIKPKMLLETLENTDIRNSKAICLGVIEVQETDSQQRFPEYQLLDLDRSLKTTGDDIGLLRQLLQLTSENITPALILMKTLETQQDWPTLARAVHKSKGMLANFCVEDMMDLMEQLIDEAEQENDQIIGPLVIKVIEQIEQFSDELTDYMKKSV